MRSISRHIDGNSIAADIRMQRQVHRGSFILFEGPTDDKRFSRFVDEDQCCPIICFGKSNLIDAVELLDSAGFRGALGLIDADFEHLCGYFCASDNVIRSQFHDFDLDVGCTSALKRYLAEVCDERKLRQLGGPENILPLVLDALKPLSALRYVNVRYDLRYRLRHLAVEQFFDGNHIDIDRMIENLSLGRFNTEEHKHRLKHLVESILAESHDVRQLTSGHDFFEGLGICLRELLGSRHIAQSYRAEVELHLRLTLDFDDLVEMGLVGLVREWEHRNPPYRILA